MERQIPYILHLSDFFSSHKHLSCGLLMYYCICVILLNKYKYIKLESWLIYDDLCCGFRISVFTCSLRTRDRPSNLTRDKANHRYETSLRSGKYRSVQLDFTCVIRKPKTVKIKVVREAAKK